VLLFATKSVQFSDIQLQKVLPKFETNDPSVLRQLPETLSAKVPDAVAESNETCAPLYRSWSPIRQSFTKTRVPPASHGRESGAPEYDPAPRQSALDRLYRRRDLCRTRRPTLIWFQRRRSGRLRRSPPAQYPIRIGRKY